MYVGCVWFPPAFLVVSVPSTCQLNKHPYTQRRVDAKMYFHSEPGNKVPYPRVFVPRYSDIRTAVHVHGEEDVVKRTVIAGKN